MVTHIVLSCSKGFFPWVSEISLMAEQVKSYGKIHSISYQDLISPDDKITRLVKHLESLSGDIILIGSGMDGYVSTVASNKVNIAGLMLLAPAFYLEGYSIQEPITPCQHISITHGWNDDIVPCGNSIRFALEHKSKLNLVYDGHQLANSQNILNSALIELLTQAS